MCAVALQPNIETERLRLRPLRMADAVYIAELANDPEVARMTTGVPYPYRLADAQGFIASRGQADPEQDLPLLIEHRQFGPIGMTGFHRTPGVRLVELGYWLGHTFRGRGFATEAAIAAVRWAHEEWGKRAVLSSHFPDNPASARVLAKAGFLYTGEVVARFSRGRGRTVDSRMMVRLA
jgi:RimJ/RimL family protein N-acetyltransferase